LPFIGPSARQDVMMIGISKPCRKKSCSAISRTVRCAESSLNSFRSKSPQVAPLYQFQDKGKFALVTFNNIYVDLPKAAFQLSDGTWAMPGLPVPDLGIWKEWVGSIRMEQLAKANLVLFVEQPSNNPENYDQDHIRLGDSLSRLFLLIHLRSGIEYDSADLLHGLSEENVPRIRHMGRFPPYYQSRGYRRAPITKEWLEDAVSLRTAVDAIEANKQEFRRVIRGLNTLTSGLKEQTGQERLHQFVRSLEALILPDTGSTRNQFAHRCQTFAGAGEDTRALLLEAFDMRSNTEHLHEWDKAVQNYPADQREDVCWQRTRQIEHLACNAFSHLLHDAALRDHFKTDDRIAAFWKMRDDERSSLWGQPLDITKEPLVTEWRRNDDV